MRKGLCFKKQDAVNVFDKPLQSCSEEPLTGFFHDGCCNTSGADIGSHTVCVEITSEFLQYSRFRGNDLSSPAPEQKFPGLKPGDRWCLSAKRWLEAQQLGMAPRVFLKATHKLTLKIIPLELLKEFALDLD